MIDPDDTCVRCGVSRRESPHSWLVHCHDNGAVYLYCPDCTPVSSRPQHDISATPVPQHKRKRFFRWM